MDGPTKIAPFPLPDEIVAKAVAGSRKVAEGGRRGAYGPSLPQITAMAHFVAMFDPAQHAHLAQLYPEHIEAPEIGCETEQGGATSPTDHEGRPDPL